MADQALSTLRAKKASCIYLIFNTHSLSDSTGTAYGTKPGLYICDMDPSATPSARNEDLVIDRGSTAIVHSLGITTGNEWKPAFDFSSAEPGIYDFFSKPYQTAYDQEGPKDADDFAYWGIAPLLGVGSERHCVSYSIPLILQDGTVYGIIGVDLSADYLKTLLPASELLSSNEGTYVFGFSKSPTDILEAEQIELFPVVNTGQQAIPGTDYGQSMEAIQRATGGCTYQADGVDYYVDIEPLRLYNTNAPFEDDRWVLAGLADQKELHRFTDQVILMIAIAALLMLLLGILGAILVGRSISRPVKELSDQVEGAQLKHAEMPTLGRTGMREIDHLTGAINTLSADIASVKMLEQQRIEHERDYDLLTGLMNRRAFYREAGKLFDSSELGNAAVVMLDLDNLKSINDAYGHDWGDKYIYQAARCFEEALGTDALVARVSGDEFFVLLHGYESSDKLNAPVERLRQAINQVSFNLPDGVIFQLSVSGGVACCPQDGTDLTELMNLADFAMYQAKSGGKNNIAFFDREAYQEQDSVRHAMSEFEELMNDYKLVDYHFQPIFSVRSGAVVAYEALMRVSMQSLRSPGDVMMLARRENRIEEVERITWNRAFESYQALVERGDIENNAHLFVNSFANISLPAEEFAELSRNFPQIMERLVIEITEAENMDEDAMAIKRAIPRFSRLFALDDYGSGYNSEIMLLDLRPDFVKVDISIIRDIDTSIDKQRIVSNLVEYAHERDMMIVAEGVETSSELATVIELDVDLAQGFYLARPARVPAAISNEAREQIKIAAERYGA